MAILAMIILVIMSSIRTSNKPQPQQRSTRQRAAILDVFSRASSPLLPEEVLRRAQNNVPNLGIATVYRAISEFLREGVIVKVELPGESSRYESSNREHHHHFQCTNCEEVFDLPGCPGDLSKLLPPGFSLEEHHLSLTGTCRSCNREK